MNDSNSNIKQPKRGILLWILSICTMIQAGNNMLLYALFLLFPDKMGQAVGNLTQVPFFDDAAFKEVIQILQSVAGWQYALLILVEMAIFAGALIMLWKLKPIGFHIYTIGQIGLFCILNFVIGGKLMMTWEAIIWTIFIVLLFASQLKYMRKPDENTQEQ
ncbi:MAG: hypothetical protein K5846_04530 [Bacteroidales bacterium]|nr:hypothetical protein [Bacteroidales bacterium]